MIYITKSKKVDSSTTNEELMNDTKRHINDVSNALKFIESKLIERGNLHDHTKIEHIDDFNKAIKSGHIKDSEWYKLHITEERHHLKSHVPDDVNLIDIIEMICDISMAGLARSGSIYDFDIDPSIFPLAIQNTIELLKANTIVSDSVDELNDNNSILDTPIDEED